jgi:5-formyltetrahydrofolate cyclo-ligase
MWPLSWPDDTVRRGSKLDSKERKAEVRERTWRRLDEERLAAFPRPIRGRIPNFKGAREAAARLAELPEFRDAKAIKVNPDAPQLPVRQAVLNQGKLLLTPTPRLREGFLLLDPAKLQRKDYRRAASIAGAAKLARRVSLDELPRIDLIVIGTVAVTERGARVGKGEGYAELEYATLRQLGRVAENVPIATTVHDVQVVDDIPVEPFDVPVDIIVTPTRVIRTRSRQAKPRGILWDLLDPARLEEMPILKELRERS